MECSALGQGYVLAVLMSGDVCVIGMSLKLAVSNYGSGFVYLHVPSDGCMLVDTI